MRYFENRSRGQIAVELLFLSAVVAVMIAGFASLAASLLRVSVRSEDKLEAFAIAEAGVEYYQWHLAYNPTDFTDGTGHAGPYVHNYYDTNGNFIGQYSLGITPPPNGSTVVTIVSTGTVAADPSIVKAIEVKLGIPSFAQYAWALNNPVYFGATAQVYGPLYSNSGIHFDGVAHNLVESALTTYTDPDSGKNEWAVYTDNAPADPQPPTALPSRPDVFIAGRILGAPALDFAGFTADLATIKSEAQASGTYFASSTAFGYDLSLSSTSYTLYKVTSLMSVPRNCTNGFGQTGWSLWSIGTESQIATGTIPQNGSLFFEDNLWVRGSIAPNIRVTIASGRFPNNPATWSSITVNNSLTYSDLTGSDAIGLIAQNNINVGYASDNNLTIDAALIAQNGWIGRYYYPSACGASYVRNQLTTLGMLGTNLRSAFAYSPTSGYGTRIYNYDANLLYAPPPSFPLSTDQYSTIFWEELQ